MIILFLLALGLALGSFTNALYWRTRKVLTAKKPKDKKAYSILTGRSKCFHCGYELKPKDLVPIVSFVLLRGRCRHCRNKIDDTPLLELMVPLLLVVSYLLWPYDLHQAEGIFRFAIWAVALVPLLAMLVYDFKWMELPNRLNYSFLGLAAVQAAGLIIINGWNGRFALSALLGIAVGGGLFELIYQLSKGKYIGGGDVRLGYGFGLLLADPLKAWMVISLASLLGTVWAVVLVFRGNYGFKSKLSFGPFLIIALIVVVLYGDRLWRLLYGGV